MARNPRKPSDQFKNPFIHTISKKSPSLNFAKSLQYAHCMHKYELHISELSIDTMFRYLFRNRIVFGYVTSAPRQLMCIKLIGLLTHFPRVKTTTTDKGLRKWIKHSAFNMSWNIYSIVCGLFCFILFADERKAICLIDSFLSGLTCYAVLSYL